MSMETTFAATTPTTSFKDRLAVMVEADYNDENGGEIARKWTALTRLDNARQTGESLDEDASATVGMLAKALGREHQKKVFVSPDTLRRMNRRSATLQAFLTDPLGPYYTKLTLDWMLYGTEEVNVSWDKNPIEAVEISMIPAGVTPDRLMSHRLGRVNAVTLHFQNPGFSEVCTLLMNVRVKLESCRVLELRNVNASESQIAMLKLRLQWPQLQSVLLAKRA